MRNTLEPPRSVVPVRLSDSERGRISKAAEARDLAFNSYVRWAVLEAAADELERQKPRPQPAVAELEPVVAEREVLVIDSEPEPQFVDGVLVGADGYPLREPHLVDGEPLGEVG